MFTVEYDGGRRPAWPPYPSKMSAFEVIAQFASRHSRTMMEVLFQSQQLLKPGVSSVDTPQVTAPSSAGDRSVLTQWFRVLHNRVRLSDRHRLNSQNVRVEASSPSDWWIHVHPQGLNRHENCGFYGHHACVANHGDEVAVYRELRVALLLTTMLARVDYDAWYEEMKLTSGLRLTSEQRDERVECKFAFTLENDTASEDKGWQEKMNALWGIDDGQGFSDAFVSSAVALRSLATSKCVNWSDVVKPVPVRLEFSQVAATPEKQSAMLDSVTETAVRAKNNDTKLAAIQGLLPAFNLQTLELYLWRHEVHASVFNALERLLRTEVQIDFLALPGRYNNDTADQDALQPAWSSLVQKLIGRHMTELIDKAPQIGRLEIPSAYFTPVLSSTWLSALATASNVRSLSIQGQASPMLSTSVFWGHIGNAVFSRHSKHSIQSLELAGLGDISTDAVAEFERVITEAQLQSVHSALQTLVLSLAPGPQPTPGIDGSLLVGPKQWIPCFLQLVGGSLTELAIDRSDADNVMLEQSLRACPSLESFRVNGAVLQSLDSLVEVYEGPERSKLTSVELRNVAVPVDTFESFLSSLADEKNAIHSTLSRLRIGEGWSNAFRKSTASALENFLNTSNILTRLEVYRAPEPFSSVPAADWSALKAHNGSFLAAIDSPLQLESRHAFLGALHRLVLEGTLPIVTEDPLRIIMELAAKARRRSVVVCSDVQHIPY